MLVARDDWTKKITHSSIIRPSIAEYKYTQKFKRGRKKKECQKHKRKSFTNLVRRRRQYRSKEKERGNPKKKKKLKKIKRINAPTLAHLFFAVLTEYSTAEDWLVAPTVRIYWKVLLLFLLRVDGSDGRGDLTDRGCYLIHIVICISLFRCGVWIFSPLFPFGGIISFPSQVIISLYTHTHT